MTSLLLALCLAQEPTLALLGDAVMNEGTVRLTPARKYRRGAAWLRERQPVRDGFEINFRFRISDPGGLRHGADGFAFVLQNNGLDELAGYGASGGFALGDGANGNDVRGIANSLAVFFDTHRNPPDGSGNGIVIATNAEQRRLRWPPPRLAANWRPGVKLKDGRPHAVRIAYRPPLLEVTVDDVLELRTPVDLRRLLPADGRAFLGFTASTGEGFENHDLFDWRFRPAVASEAYTVSSNISFAPFECLAGRALCTPAQAAVQLTSPGTYHVILPAHRPWSAEVPNPAGRRFEVRNAVGTACWEKESCGTPGTAPEGAAGSLAWRVQAGRIAFALTDPQPGDNQGYYEFDVVFEN